MNLGEIRRTGAALLSLLAALAVATPPAGAQAYVTQAASGAGFCELVDFLLAAR